MKTAERAGVLIVEDDTMVRRELVASISRADDLRVCADVGTLLAARQSLDLPGLSLALVDLQLPDGNAIALLPELRLAGISALVLTSSEESAIVFDALAAGAGGYLLKSEAINGVNSALASLRDGGAPISPRIARMLIARLVPTAQLRPEPPLTPRETEIIELFAKGATYSEVATALGISVNTVRQHVRSLYEKLHVCTKTEAVLRLRERQP
jgi:DNA-binding NarL/FixJ family response regulator